MTQDRPSFPSRPIAVAAVAAAAVALLSVAAPPAGAQHPATGATAAAAPVPGPAVGDMAPDFTLVGATRYGVLRDSVRLSSFRGQTVVLAFFYKARTKG
jgi:hypothetical protein